MYALRRKPTYEWVGYRNTHKKRQEVGINEIEISPNATSAKIGNPRARFRLWSTQIRDAGEDESICPMSGMCESYSGFHHFRWHLRSLSYKPQAMNVVFADGDSGCSFSRNRFHSRWHSRCRAWCGIQYAHYTPPKGNKISILLVFSSVVQDQ